MSNGKITIKSVYDAIGDVNCKVSEMKGKTDIMAVDLSVVKKTLQEHTEKIGFLRGQATMWGFVGGGIATIVGGIIIYWLTVHPH
jgi:hypothetical protein